MAKTILDETVESRQFTLEKLRVGAAKQLGSSLAESVEVHFSRDIPGLDGLLMELSAYVLGSRIAEDHYEAHFNYDVPASWYQHLKKDHFPRWFRERWPVRYESKHMTKTVQFTRFETYPKANIAMPKDERTISFVGDVRPIYDRVEQL